MPGLSAAALSSGLEAHSTKPGPTDISLSKSQIWRAI